MSSRIFTVPNVLTVFRMVLIPVFVSLLFYQRFLLALCVFVTAGLTDGLDGLLARRFNQKSQLGTILDPIADKLMLVTAFIVLSMTASSSCQGRRGCGIAEMLPANGVLGECIGSLAPKGRGLG